VRFDRIGISENYYEIYRRSSHVGGWRQLCVVMCMRNGVSDLGLTEVYNLLDVDDHDMS